MHNYVISLAQVGMKDVDKVGGKNASLGEMISQLSDAGIRVPGGFATTADAFNEFLNYHKLGDKISAALASLNVDDVRELARVGAEIRSWIEAEPLQPELAKAIKHGYEELCDGNEISVAVRSSATAEDLPDASFAGQQETFFYFCF